MIDTIILVVSVGIMNILCFFIGAKIGQKVANNQSIETPQLNPIKAINNAISEHIDKKEKEAEEEYYKTLMYNIDHYSGDSLGQKDLPRK